MQLRTGPKRASARARSRPLMPRESLMARAHGKVGRQSGILLALDVFLFTHACVCECVYAKRDRKTGLARARVACAH